MDTEKIKLVAKQFALEAKKAYGDALQEVILYGSCARGDFEKDSDIDIMVLLDIPQEQIGKAKITDYIINICRCLYFIKMYRKKVCELPEYTTIQKDYAKYRLEKSKEDTEEQIANAEYIHNAISKYIKQI